MSLKPRPSIQGLGVGMSNFRAINRPSASPQKPTSAGRSLSEKLFTESCKPLSGQALVLSPEQAAFPKQELDRARTQGYPKVVLHARRVRTSPKKKPMASSTARPCVAVLPTDNQSSRPCTKKDDIEQTVAKAAKAMHTSSKKKRTSDSSKSKAQRQQAPRKKKFVPSIEHSARKRYASSTPDGGTDGAKDSDYIPSPAELVDTALSSASNTPSRRSPRKHSSTCTNAGCSAFSGSTSGSSSLPSSSQAGGTLAVIKRESTLAPRNMPNLEAAVMPRSPSPSIWNKQLRRKRFDEADFVELPKEVFEYQKIKKEMAVKREAMMAGKRKEKGKFTERRPAEETHESTQRIDKRKAGEVEEVEQIEPRKRQKSLTLPKAGLDDHSITDESKIFREQTQSSKRRSAQRSPKGKTVELEAQRYRAVMIKAEDRSDRSDVGCHAEIDARGCSSEGSKDRKAQRFFRASAQVPELQVPEEQIGRSDDEALMHREQQRRPMNEDWRKPYKRREVFAPEVARSCSCALLPEYFTKKPEHVPCLTTWPGGKLEFFVHVKQISCCRGSIHPPNVIDACRRMLRKQNYLNCGDEQSPESKFEFAHEFLSTNERDGGHSGRAQSSISPPDFYGYGQSYRPPTVSGSLSRSSPVSNKTLNTHPGSGRKASPKDAANEFVPPKTLLLCDKAKDITLPTARPVGQHRNPAIVDDTSGSSLPSRSSSLGKTRRADIPSIRIFDDPTDEENVVVRRFSRGSPEASSGRAEPQVSFSAQRVRHQSVPINLGSRKRIVNERDPSPRVEQQGRDNTLQEVSYNAILNMNRKITSFEKVVLEHLLPTLHAQSAAVRPVNTPTATAAAQGGSRPERSHVRKKKKKSVAEQQLRLPVLDRNVPMHLRLPDEDLIEIGRIVNHYERHKKAPYTFSWGGRLLVEYSRLLSRRNNGVPAWTAEEINRVRR